MSKKKNPARRRSPAELTKRLEKAEAELARLRACMKKPKSVTRPLRRAPPRDADDIPRITARNPPGRPEAEEIYLRAYARGHARWSPKKIVSTYATKTELEKAARNDLEGQVRILQFRHPSSKRPRAPNPDAAKKIDAMVRKTYGPDAVWMPTENDAGDLFVLVYRTQREAEDPDARAITRLPWNPRTSKSEREKGAAAYVKSHWGKKGKAPRGRALLVPAVEACASHPEKVRVVELGTWEEGITYSTRKEDDPSLTNYTHPWGDGARSAKLPLICYHDCDVRDCPDQGLLIVAVRGQHPRVDPARGIVG